MRDADADFVGQLRSRARARRRRLVFAEGADPRVLAAARRAVEDDLYDQILLGPADEVRRGLAETGIEPDAVDVHDPTAPEAVERFGAVLYDLRRERGTSEEEARALALDPLLQAALMVRLGDADGSVAGCVRTTGDVIVAAIRGVGIAEGISTVSSSFYMAFPDSHPRGPCVLTFTDAGVVPDPTPEQLAEIAVAAAGARGRIVGDEPRVAFLSYSTLGSAEGPAVESVRRAVELFRQMLPGVIAEGELQGDAALSPEVASRKAPASAISGDANVLVFPDLSAANIAYKLVQQLGGAVALGPILQGLARPCNDLSRGADAADIVSVGCITSLMAE